MATDAYARELDELMVACRKASLPVVGPTDHRFGATGVLVQVPYGSTRLRGFAPDYGLTPSGRRHTIIEVRG